MESLPDIIICYFIDKVNRSAGKYSLARKNKKSKKVLTNALKCAIIASLREICWCGSMAEQLICNQQVVGSTPITSSKTGEFQVHR